MFRLPIILALLNASQSNKIANHNVADLIIDTFAAVEISRSYDVTDDSLILWTETLRPSRNIQWVLVLEGKMQYPDRRLIRTRQSICLTSNLQFPQAYGSYCKRMPAGPNSLWLISSTGPSQITLKTLITRFIRFQRLQRLSREYIR